MKFAALALYLSLFANAMCANSQPIQTTKSANKAFNAATEVKTFYLKLLDSDSGFIKEFEAQAKNSSLWGDVHSGTAEPQIVAWYPRQDEWNDEGFSQDQHFLVIQPIEFGRQRWLEYDFAVVSEFRVLREGKSRVDPKDRHAIPKFVSNKITIQFLGFREFKSIPSKIAE